MSSSLAVEVAKESSPAPVAKVSDGSPNAKVTESRKDNKNGADVKIAARTESIIDNRTLSADEKVACLIRLINNV